MESGYLESGGLCNGTEYSVNIYGKKRQSGLRFYFPTAEPLGKMSRAVANGNQIGGSPGLSAPDHQGSDYYGLVTSHNTYYCHRTAKDFWVVIFKRKEYSVYRIEVNIIPSRVARPVLPALAGALDARYKWPGREGGA